MDEGGMMYNIYLIGHFALAVTWLWAAVYLDFTFLKYFNKATTEEKKSLIVKISFLSDKTEMVASFFLPLLGILMLIDRTFWLKVGTMHGKITLALLAIGLFHASRGVLRKIEAALDSGNPIETLQKKYVAFRMIVLLFLVVTVGMILAYKGGIISAIFLIKSWLT